MMKAVVAGLGSAGIAHLGNVWAHPDLEAVAAFDPGTDPEKLERSRCTIENTKKTLLNQGFPEPRTLKMYDNWLKLLDSEKPDIAVIASPDKFHCELTLAALERGVHVLVEKPMGVSLDECQRIIEAQKKSSAKLMTNQCVRFCLKFQEIRKRIDQGDLGTVYYAESNYVSARYDQMDGRGHHDESHPLLTVGIHPIDMLRWIVGSEVVSVTAESAAIAAQGTKYTWPDFCKVNMKFANGALAMSYTTHAVRRPGYLGLLAYGTKASVMDDHPYYTQPYTFPEFDTQGNVELYRLFRSRDWADQEEIRLGPELKGTGHMFGAVMRHFVNAIQTNTQPLVTALEAARSLAVCHAAIESLEKGGTAVKPRQF